MEIKADQIPMEAKWEMAAKGLTSALVAHMNAIYEIVGPENYTKVIQKIWAEIGKGSAQGVLDSHLPVEDAGSLAQTSAISCLCAMGPEYKIKEVESSSDKAVMKITKCPFKNRLDEFQISHDLMSACDTAFWKQFVETLNPDIKMRHGKQMHIGDSFCEWIFEKK